MKRASSPSVRKAQAKAKVTALVQAGYRLNPEATTSVTYRNAVANTGRGAERRAAAASMNQQARTDGRDRPIKRKKGK